MHSIRRIDIGVQFFGEHTPQEAEETVLFLCGIYGDRYLLSGVQGGVVNGIDYAAMQSHRSGAVPHYWKGGLQDR